MRYDLLFLDVDGTLYDLDDVADKNYMIAVEFLERQLDVSRQEAEGMLTEHGISKRKNQEAKSATEFFEHIGISRESWKFYRESKFDIHWIDRTKAVDLKVLYTIVNSVPTILLSSNSYDNIIKILNCLKVDARMFAGIYTFDRRASTGNFNKKKEMVAICDRYGISPAKTYAVGDRYHTDVEPLVELGGSGMVIDSPLELVNIAARFQKEGDGA